MTTTSLKQQSRIILDNSVTRLGGIDVGQYPLHRFLYNHAPQQEGWPLRIEFAGTDEWVKGCYRYREHSEIFAVEFVREGCFRFIRNNSEFTAGPDNVFLIHPGCDVEMMCESDYARKETVCLAGPLLPALLETLGLERTGLIAVRSPEELAGCFNEAVTLLRERPDEFAPRSSLLLYRLLHLLALHLQREDTPEPLTSILRYLDRHLGEMTTIDELTSHFHLSAATLHRLFRRTLGVSPIHYQLNRKMEAARRLLLATEEPVKEIAFRLGYSNALYFSAEFRRFTGESPRNRIAEFSAIRLDNAGNIGYLKRKSAVPGGKEGKLRTSRQGGGTADAIDLKSIGQKTMRVRIPSLAPPSVTFRETGAA